MYEIRAPQLNNNDDEFLVLEWLVSEGDLVNVGDEILLVETSKATATVEADAPGYIRTLVRVGDTVRKGQVIAVMAETRAAWLNSEALAEGEPPAPQASEEATQVQVPEGRATAHSATDLEASEKIDKGNCASTVLFSKSARDYIDTHQIDVDALRLKGAISKRDLIAALPGASTPPVDTNTSKLKGKRVSRAKAREIELLTAGQAGGINSSLTIQFRSAALRRKFSELNAPNGFMLSHIVTALGRELKISPEFNAYYSEGGIYTHGDVHIGVAMDMGNGLVTPVIRSADQKSALEVHKEIADYSLKYVESTLTEDDISGSTITVTDLSNDDVLHFQPLLNKEQACILGVGADRHLDGYPLTLTLVFDHRVLAGKAVSAFLNRLKERLFRVDEGLVKSWAGGQRAARENPSAGHAVGSSIAEREQEIIECFAKVMRVRPDQVEYSLEIARALPASKEIMQVTAALLKAFPGTPSTLLFECRLVADVVRYLLPTEAQPSAKANHSPRGSVGAFVHSDQSTFSRTHNTRNEDIAIVGVSGKYPQCADLDEFWQALRNGLDLTTGIPADRWNMAASYQEAGENGKSYCRKGGFLSDVNRFEAAFFGISPKESKYMDPQQRLFLEVVWNLLENAGYTPASLSRQTGVYVGVIASDYSIYTGNASVAGVSAYRASDYYQIANRVSHFLDLRGPSLAIDTACASSGTAIHLACEAIRAGEVDAAIAGGVNLFLHPSRFIQYSQMKMISPANVCRPFSEDADGTLFGEGVGAVLLKPLSSAEADGDHIWGVIKATTVNSGGKTNGFTVPNPNAQAELITSALNKANISAQTISYVEAHGTGTKLGDPIEIRGLTKAFFESGQRFNVNLATGSCAVGSVKSNIGHLESAAAISGLTKILLQMRERLIAPTLGGGSDNTLLGLEQSPFRIQRTLTEWDGPHPRRACLSSFGAGGVNSHLIVQEYEASPEQHTQAGRSLENQASELIPVVLSSTTDAKVQAYAARLKAKVERRAQCLPPEERGSHLRRVAFTLFVGRVRLKVRRVLWVSSLEMLTEGLAIIASGGVLETALSEAQTTATEQWLAGDDNALSGYFMEPLPKVELPGYVFLGPEYRLPHTSLPQAEQRNQVPAPVVKRYREVWTPSSLKGSGGEPVLMFDEGRWPVVTSDLTENANISVVRLDETLFGSLQAAKACAQVCQEAIRIAATAGDGTLNIAYLYQNHPSEGPGGDGEIQLINAVAPLFHLLQALKGQVARAPVNLIYAGDWTGNPYGGAFSGLARTLCVENPHYRVRNIDLSVGWSTGDLLSMLQSEFSDMRSGFAEIKYENGQRYRREIVAASSVEAPGSAAAFREQGTYVITGGCGQLGSVVAAEIAEVAGVKLALLGSSAIDDHKESLIGDLRARGAQVGYFQADCANRDSLEKALAQVRARFGRVMGIVHCAGAIRDRYFTQKTLDEFLAVIRGKILGAVYLDQLTLEDQPALFVNFSSTSAFGNVGQTDYAYANRFLDVFADWRSQREREHQSTISINWPFWRSGGMSIADEDLASLQSRYGLLPLETDVGSATLNDILRSPDGGRIVLYGLSDHFEKRIEQWNQMESRDSADPSGAHVFGENPVSAPNSRDELLVDTAELLAFTEAKVSKIICEIAEIDPVGFSATEEMEHYGFDSIMVNQFNVKVEAMLGATSRTLMYECRDVRGLAQRVYELKTPRLRELYRAERRLSQPLEDRRELVGSVETGSGNPFKSFDGEQTSTPVMEKDQSKPRVFAAGDIAIVGIAGRYPGAPTLERFWENLSEGRDAIAEIPADRWDPHDYYDADPAAAKEGKIYCKWGGFIEGAYDFDPLFFNISPAEAEALDPQERLFLEICWTALADAGYARRHARVPEDGFGKDVGVYVGVTTNDHQMLWTEARRQSSFQAPLSHPWSIANRVSYYFNFTGPSIAYDTACSASLTAIHYACESLRHGEVRMALAGGVNLYLHPAKYVEMCQMGMLSRTGRCHTFGDAADGFVPGEGVGCVVLKTLADAIAAGDHVYGVIKATAINHGGKVNGFTVPNPNAQKSLILDALQRSGIDPSSISYVEAHGTGTKLGDPIEIAALTEAYKREGQALGYCAIGSVKSNIGHLESAAGIAGLTKIVLQLHHKTLVPSLNAVHENSNIDFGSTPFRVQKRREPWVIQSGGSGDKRRAALSSFGAGGNNAHLIIEEHVAAGEAQASNGRKLFSSASPFERQTYRLVKPGKPSSSYFDSIEKVESALQLSKTVDVRSFVFSDHQINGIGSLPGVFSLDLVLRANREVRILEGKILLKNVVWVNPVTLQDNQLLLRLTPVTERQVKFEIVSGVAGEILHTTGKMESAPDAAGEEQLSFSLAQTASSLAGRAQNVEHLYRRMRNFGVLHGPSFQVIRSILCDGQRLLSSYQLPPSLAPSFGEFIAHPSILDGAMQVIISLVRRTAVEGGDTPYLFFELKEMELLKPIAESGYIYEELVSHGGEGSNMHKFNVLFVDEAGEICARLQGATIKTMPSRKATAGALELRRAWVESPLPKTSSSNELTFSPSGSLLLFGQDEALQNALGERVILITPATEFLQKSSACFAMDFTRREHHRRLLEVLNASGVVVENCVYHEPRADQDDPLSAWGITQFAAAFVESELPGKLNFLYLFQSRAGEVSPHACGVKSLIKNLSRETTRIHFKSLEIAHDGRTSELPLAPAVANAIRQELCLPPGQECHLRWEKSRRYGERWLQVGESTSTEPRRHSSGSDPGEVFLVTGGMGGLGRHLVRELLQRPRTRVILAGRREVGQRELEELYAGSQGRLRYVRCDISAHDQIRELSREVREGYGKLTAIYHAAGVIKDARFTSKTREDFLAVLAPKVRGTVNLGGLAEQTDCERVILFSSTASVLGAPGQSDYAYANGFMDGYAAHMNGLPAADGPRWISIGWPLWEEGGMRPDGAFLRLMQDQYGQVPLETRAGLQYLRRYETCRESQVLLLIGDSGKYSKYLPLELRTEAPEAPRKAEEGNLVAQEFYTSALREFLSSTVGQIIKLAPQKISGAKEFGAYGFDSLKLTELANQVNRWLGSDLMPSHFYEFTTVEAVTSHLWREYEENVRRVISAKEDERHSVAGAPRYSAAAPVNPRDIAIIGMAGRFPGADTLDEFWDNIKDGKNLVTRIPHERWNWEDYEGDPAQGNFSDGQWGGFIRDIDCFDAAFFEISPREARYMDPQQRILIELVWQAVQDSARKVGDLVGTDTSVFVGVANSDYKELLKVHLDSVDAHMSTGVMSHSIISNRISYLLGTRGRSESIDTACSSSLVAIDRAVATLLSGESELAIAAGVNALLSPTPYISFSKAGLLSGTGACRTFDASADGYVRAEGAGVLVLKTLARALQDGDPIHAVIKASAVNHGGRANTLTSPNTLAQAEVIVEAHKRANIDPRSVGYLEAHGTGTSLGDPIEIDGLKKAFRRLLGDWDSQRALENTGEEAASKYPVESAEPIGISSIKANIGHLETAAGIAGVIKAVLSIKNRCLTGNIHLRQQNPYISLTNTPFRLLTQAEPWDAPRGATGERLPRRAAVSSFGFGGTNAHVVLEEYSAPAAEEVLETVNREKLIVLSAKSQTSLRAMVSALLTHLEREGGALRLECLEYTLQHARDEYAHRLALVASGETDLRAKLKSYLQGELHPNDGSSATVDSEKVPEPRRTADMPGDWRNPLALAKFWVEGGDISWSEVVPASAARRIHAPGYMFEKASHWYRDFHQAAAPRVRVESTKPVAPRMRAKGPSSIRLKVANVSKVQESLSSPAEQPAKDKLQPSRLPQQNSRAITAQSNNASREFISSQVLATLAEILLCNEQAILEARTFNQLGLDSVLTTELCGILSGTFGFKIKATEIYDHHNFSKLVDYIDRTQSAAAESERTLVPPVEASAAVEAVDAPSEARTSSSHTDAEAVKPEIVRMVAEVLYMKPSDVRHRIAFSELGLDSILLVELAKNLSARFGHTIKAVDLYDNSNVEALSGFIARSTASSGAAAEPRKVVPASRTLSTGESRIAAEPSIDDQAPLAPANSDELDRRVAIIGISCRFPGANNPSQFWDNLHRGVDSIREVDSSRWDAQKFYSADDSLTDHISCKWGGFLDAVNMFDPKFFDISYIEAKMMDPQQRIFLQQCWSAIEDAGYTKEDLDGMNCGVNAGVIQNDYRALFYGKEFEVSHSLGMTGNSNAILAARISYWLNLKGPAITVDTACSSGLVAIDMAVRALVLGEVDMMLAGGVTLYLNEIPYLGMSNAGMLSKEGKCKTFDNSADGFVPAEGAAVVVLKRLSKAQADGDHIYGVIRGSGVNQDGRTNGITAPSIESQRDLVRRVQQKAGVDPATISYVEAHGTGTILGDPIEVEALKQAFARPGANVRKQYCAIGSVKSNIGHTSAAAGLAGLIKVLLAFQHETIPASLHYREENRHLDLRDSPFFVNVENMDWKADGQERRLAALSSFGFSGTNCHLLLEDYPNRQQTSADEVAPHLFTLSARSEAALRDRVVEMREFLASADESARPAAVACTLLCGRDHYAYRLAIVATDLGQLSRVLLEFLESRENPAYFYNHGVPCPATLKRSLTDYGNRILRDLSANSPRVTADATTLAILAELYTNDISLTWKWLYDRMQVGVVSLPTYPFEKVDCWLEKAVVCNPTSAVAAARHAPQANGSGAAGGETVSSPVRKNISLIVPKGEQPRRIPTQSSDTAGVEPVAGRPVNGRHKPKLKLSDKPSLPQPLGVDGFDNHPASLQRSNAALVSKWASGINRILADMLLVSADCIDPELSFQEMGVDSIIGVEFVKELNREFSLGIDTNSLYRYPCVSRLVTFLTCREGDASRATEAEHGWVEDTQSIPAKENPARIASTPRGASARPTTESFDDVVAFLRATLAELLLVTDAEIAAQAVFADLGLDSIIGVEFIKHINRRYGVKVKSSSLYTHPDLESYSRYLQRVLDERAVTSKQLEIENFVSGLSGDELERELNRQLEATAGEVEPWRPITMPNAN